MLLNNELSISFPEGFNEMSLEERKKLKLLAEGPGVCLSDPERHMIVSIGWKPLGLLPRLILNTSDIAAQTAKAIRQAMTPFSYRGEKAVEKKLGGLTAKGISYQYDAEGVEMTGETLAVKSKKTLYYFHVYTRTALLEENQALWDTLLAEGRWV